MYTMVSFCAAVGKPPFTTPAVGCFALALTLVQKTGIWGLDSLQLKSYVTCNIIKWPLVGGSVFQSKHIIFVYGGHSK